MVTSLRCELSSDFCMLKAILQHKCKYIINYAIYGNDDVVRLGGGGGGCYGRLPPKASSRVDSNCSIHFWGLYFSCWDEFRLWFVAVLSRRHSPLVMGPCSRLCLIHFTSPGLVTHHDRVTSCLHRFCQSWHLFPVATAISYRLSVFLMSRVLWWGVQYQIPTGYPP